MRATSTRCTRTKSIIVNSNLQFSLNSLSFIVTINSDCYATFDINVRASLNAALLLRSKWSPVAAHLLPPFRRKHLQEV